MDTNMKVRIVRDCLTTAKADLPVVGLASDYAPDVRITRVLVGACRVAVYCETNTGYAYKRLTANVWATW